MHLTAKLTALHTAAGQGLIRLVNLQLFFCLLLSLCACNGSSSGNRQKFDEDMNYYLALKAVDTDRAQEAMQLFKKAQKNGSTFISRRSAEALTKLGNIQERTDSALELYNTYQDDDSLIRAVSELVHAEEYSQVISLTQGINIAESSNKLIRLRLTALQKKGDPRLADTVYQWYTKRAISQEHFKYYLASVISTTQNICDMNQQIIITFRIETYRKSYINAYKQLSSVITIIDSDDRLSLTPQIISDMGKVSLYGSSLWQKNAAFFDTLAKNAEVMGDTVNTYFALFYAARLYEKGGNYYTAANTRYKKSMEQAPSDFDFDNSLWYLINMDMGISPEKAMATIKQYCTQWHNPLYFTDLFDTLSVLLLSSRSWNDFYKVYNIIEGCADESTCSKYAYLSGRLIELGLAETRADPADEARTAYTQALNSGTNTYYKMLAAHQLGLTGTALEKVMKSTKINPSFTKNDDMEKLLDGYAVFGFPQYIYSEWQTFTSNGQPLSLECAERLSQFMQDCTDAAKSHFAQSIRIISRTIDNCDTEVTVNALKLMYPQDYSELVQQACKTYNLSEYLLYALIRSESLFDPEIQSSAGAVGLTQLMEGTAKDVAAKLHKDTYDLNDPATNIEFGSYYLSNLISRLNNSPIMAVFAYNSGITRVRTWLRDSHLEIGSRKLPMDIFLETIPYAETREYGRKIISAAAMYGWLYYNKPLGEIITEILS